MTQNEFSYIKGDTWVFVFIGGQTYNIDQSHLNYKSILSAIKRNDADAVRKALNPGEDIKENLETASGTNKVVFDNGVIYYKGEQIHNVLTDRIMEMYRDSFDVTPMVNFLDNLLDNPSRQSIEELYSFLEVNKMPITDDGHFLAFKRVRANYTDVHSGKNDNSVGAVVEMNRNEVDDRRDNTCSAGLHFCSVEYLGSGFGGSYNPIMILKINPADVVSIPIDYNNSKGRCCRYEVVGEHGNVAPSENPCAYVRTEGEYKLTDSYDESDWVVNAYGYDNYAGKIPFTCNAAWRLGVDFYLPITEIDYELYLDGIDPESVLCDEWRCAITGIAVSEPTVCSAFNISSERLHSLYRSALENIEDSVGDIREDDEIPSEEVLRERAYGHFLEATGRTMCFSRESAQDAGHPYFFDLTRNAVGSNKVYYKDHFVRTRDYEIIERDEFAKVAYFYFPEYPYPKEVLINYLDITLDRVRRDLI